MEGVYALELLREWEASLEELGRCRGKGTRDDIGRRRDIVIEGEETGSSTT